MLSVIVFISSFCLFVLEFFFFHRIEHAKLVKQGQDCQNVIAKKSLRIYIYIDTKRGVSYNTTGNQATGLWYTRMGYAEGKIK